MMFPDLDRTKEYTLSEFFDVFETVAILYDLRLVMFRQPIGSGIGFRFEKYNDNSTDVVRSNPIFWLHNKESTHDLFIKLVKLARDFRQEVG